MKKAFIVNKEIMLAESEVPESVELKVRDFTILLTRKEYADLCGCQYSIDYMPEKAGE